MNPFSCCIWFVDELVSALGALKPSGLLFRLLKNYFKGKKGQRCAISTKKACRAIGSSCSFSCCYWCLRHPYWVLMEEKRSLEWQNREKVAAERAWREILAEESVKLFNFKDQRRQNRLDAAEKFGLWLRSTNLGWHLAEDTVISVLLKHAVFWEVCTPQNQECCSSFCALLTSSGSWMCLSMASSS